MMNPFSHDFNLLTGLQFSNSAWCLEHQYLLFLVFGCNKIAIQFRYKLEEMFSKL